MQIDLTERLNVVYQASKKGDIDVRNEIGRDQWRSLLERLKDTDDKILFCKSEEMFCDAARIEPNYTLGLLLSLFALYLSLGSEEICKNVFDWYKKQANHRCVRKMLYK